MNLAHLHLLLNHLPILGVPIASLFLAHGIFKGNDSSRNFAYLILLLMAATVIPTYLTGEPAEKVIEHIPDFSEDFIKPHEDAALVSLILTLLLGSIAIFRLIFVRNEFQERKIAHIALSLTLVATTSLAYTGYQGGKVRHTELREESKVITTHE